MNTTPASRWTRFKNWLLKAEKALTAGPRVQAGVGLALACLTVVAAILVGGRLRIGINPILDPIIGTLMFMALFALFVLLTVISVRLALILAGLFSWRAFLVLAGLDDSGSRAAFNPFHERLPANSWRYELIVPLAP